MTERQEAILMFVIESYINTVEPIGSSFLSENSDFDVSGATIRNELRALEEMGYLTHPHTSAGRIPTELGYKYYVEHLDLGEEITKDTHNLFDTSLVVSQEPKEKIKAFAKFSAEFAGNAVIVSFGKNSLYYTGISNLFSQPEFQNYAYTLNVSSVFDECESRIPEVYEQIAKNEIKVFIGSENPFGGECSSIVTRFGNEHLFILLGPMRMRYKNNIKLISKIHDLMH
ncbi:MAG: hypothetical protein COV59_04315 [Candidatus Magasanikbacteria bacterium CG11_big_fil_rev_8_21_14_0_20_39_34]|uniref:Heat-inducible transcription repressor HrcA C-terminal domain-containing protein n=1 Tax=Candidatus Magasanikbacteria bacterium CG11_big_fil_rev_8_21_14_0_20_39_34 TaxID=1974653 RepID=A0A2H0N4N9_9BACT|nr:MAG: hypothetical protein COV59_04315 [Candidatus Magasanikbacteria bacterium CG11_big_fil_rev_8_21_14_0_20_39_34]